MIVLNDDYLKSVGLGRLAQEEKASLLRWIWDTLECRVGDRLSRNLSVRQLAEFNVLMDAGDEAAALRWLSETIPNYRGHVVAEFERLSEELRASANKILSERGVAN